MAAEDVTGLAAADVLAALWWLVERQAVDLCQFVLTVYVHPSVDSPWLYIPKNARES